MEFLIIYFSGTGNTQLIAEEIKKSLQDKDHSVELISTEEKEKLENLDLKNKVIGFGYPVYKFSYPDIFNEIFSETNHAAISNKYFQFSTYARFDAEAFYDFSKKLDNSKFDLIAEKSFKAPSCGISARKSVDDYEYESVMFFEDNICSKIDEFTSEIITAIIETKNIKQKHGLLSVIKKKVVADVEITKYPKLQVLGEKCTVCGLCANKCPEDNLVKSDNSIIVKDEVKCLHCLRCMNHCPTNAIIFGELSKGDNQYTLKIRNDLYKKASDGYKEKYWDDFGNVIKKWQRNTIKYWITHRMRPQ